LTGVISIFMKFKVKPLTPVSLVLCDTSHSLSSTLPLSLSHIAIFVLL
uniref:Uncharacterized protein n=1 Tax=Amphimedon queenslandica TaxID=400682 RepID=A0A1X7T6J1_AMPQE